MSLPPYQYRGAAAMVALHEIELRKFVALWKKAKAGEVGHPFLGVKSETDATGQPRMAVLPETDDPSYASLDALVQHLLRASRGYMVWCCEQLGLPDPGIPATPPPDQIAAQVDSYLEILLEKWRAPLKDVPEEAFFDKTYLSRWKVPYCIEAMVEHAVVHPMRHGHQLENLLKGVRV